MGRQQKVGNGVLDEVSVLAVLALHSALDNAGLDEKGVQLLEQSLGALGKRLVDQRLGFRQRFVAQLC